ncbi:MAG: D-aminoacylase [Verrucomicrobia bacterium]|nr:D-aminoacylase [Verrucomicrobiota bacterium]
MKLFLRLLLFALPLATALPGSAADYDLVLRHGRIADGSGKPLFPGDVAVRAGRIVAVGEVTGSGATEVDARGQVIAPGFIDVHTHSENLAQLPHAENFLRMGVTTIVTGNCGGSRTDVAAFFAELERTNVTLNVATLIGHNTVRNQVMGGSFLRPPTDSELARMKALVEQAMNDGAVGLSTGLIYLPGTFAKTGEIIELARVASAHGGIYASHMRYETTKIFTALDELTRIAREAHIRAEVSHLKLSGPNAWGKAGEVVAYLDRARAGGLEITHDQYAYTASSTGLAQLIPDQAREGGSKKFLERLADPAQKSKLIADMKGTLKKSGHADYTYAVIAQYRPDKSLNGKTIPQAAKLKRGSDSLDDQIELILDLERHGGGSGIYHGMSEDDLRVFLRQPLTMIASDGGPRLLGDGVPHPRSYGNNARVLGRYVRELKLLTLEDAIRKMTALPAHTFRLGDRGEIKPGCVADLVVFDPGEVSDPAAFDDPHHYAVGFSEVFVNGVAVLRDGKLTQARPGKAVRLK